MSADRGCTVFSMGLSNMQNVVTIWIMNYLNFIHYIYYWKYIVRYWFLNCFWHYFNKYIILNSFEFNDIYIILSIANDMNILSYKQKTFYNYCEDFMLCVSKKTLFSWAQFVHLLN